MYGVEEGEITAANMNKAPFIDAFLRVLKGDQYVTIGMFEDEFIKPSELESPTIYKLDGLYLHGPSGVDRPGGYLERVYGSDWRVPLKSHTHINALRPDRLKIRTFEGFKRDQLAVKFVDSDPAIVATAHPAGWHQWIGIAVIVIAIAAVFGLSRRTRKA